MQTKVEIFRAKLRRYSWTLLLAALFAIAPPAIRYVAIAGLEMSESLTKEEANRLAVYAYTIERPGRMLLEARYPMYWHSHLQKKYFWGQVAQYFALNFVSWWIIVFGLSFMARRLGIVLMSSLGARRRTG